MLNFKYWLINNKMISLITKVIGNSPRVPIHHKIHCDNYHNSFHNKNIPNNNPIEHLVQNVLCKSLSIKHLQKSTSSQSSSQNNSKLRYFYSNYLAKNNNYQMCLSKRYAFSQYTSAQSNIITGNSHKQSKSQQHQEQQSKAQQKEEKEQNKQQVICIQTSKQKQIQLQRQKNLSQLIQLNKCRKQIISHNSAQNTKPVTAPNSHQSPAHCSTFFHSITNKITQLCHSNQYLSKGSYTQYNEYPLVKLIEIALKLVENNATNNITTDLLPKQVQQYQKQQSPTITKITIADHWKSLEYNLRKRMHNCSFKHYAQILYIALQSYAPSSPYRFNGSFVESLLVGVKRQITLLQQQQTMQLFYILSQYNSHQRIQSQMQMQINQTFQHNTLNNNTTDSNQKHSSSSSNNTNNNTKTNSKTQSSHPYYENQLLAQLQNQILDKIVKRYQNKYMLTQLAIKQYQLFKLMTWLKLIVCFKNIPSFTSSTHSDSNKPSSTISSHNSLRNRSKYRTQINTASFYDHNILKNKFILGLVNVIISKCQSTSIKQSQLFNNHNINTSLNTSNNNHKAITHNNNNNNNNNNSNNQNTHDIIKNNQNNIIIKNNNQKNNNNQLIIQNNSLKFSSFSQLYEFLSIIVMIRDHMINENNQLTNVVNEFSFKSNNDQLKRQLLQISHKSKSKAQQLNKIIIKITQYQSVHSLIYNQFQINQQNNSNNTTPHNNNNRIQSLLLSNQLNQLTEPETNNLSQFNGNLSQFNSPIDSKNSSPKSDNRKYTVLMMIMQCYKCLQLQNKQQLSSIARTSQKNSSTFTATTITDSVNPSAFQDNRKLSTHKNNSRFHQYLLKLINDYNITQQIIQSCNNVSNAVDNNNSISNNISNQNNNNSINNINNISNNITNINNLNINKSSQFSNNYEQGISKINIIYQLLNNWYIINQNNTTITISINFKQVYTSIVQYHFNNYRHYRHINQSYLQFNNNQSKQNNCISINSSNNSLNNQISMKQIKPEFIIKLINIQLILYNNNVSGDSDSCYQSQLKQNNKNYYICGNFIVKYGDYLLGISESKQTASSSQQKIYIRELQYPLYSYLLILQSYLQKQHVFNSQQNNQSQGLQSKRQQSTNRYLLLNRVRQLLQKILTRNSQVKNYLENYSPQYQSNFMNANESSINTFVSNHKFLTLSASNHNRSQIKILRQKQRLLLQSDGKINGYSKNTILIADYIMKMISYQRQQYLKNQNIVKLTKFFTEIKAFKQIKFSFPITSFMICPQFVFVPKSVSKNPKILMFLTKEQLQKTQLIAVREIYKANHLSLIPINIEQFLKLHINERIDKLQRIIVEDIMKQQSSSRKNNFSSLIQQKVKDHRKIKIQQSMI